MFNYTVHVKSRSTDNVFEIIGTSDQELNEKTLLQILLSDKDFVSVQDENNILGFFKHKYIKYCTAKTGHAF